MKLSSIITLLSTPSLALSLGFPNTRKEFQLTDNGSMEHLYARYKLYFNKIYNPSEDPAHSAIFTSTVENVFDWNEANHSYSKGINIFSDMDTHSKKQYIMTETYVDVHKSKASGSTDAEPKSKYLSGLKNPNTCDLRPFSTSIKDQGSCGSCWAFGTMAAAEASHFLWSTVDSNGTAALTSDRDAWQLSEQVLVDCCTECNGCGGGGASEPMACAVDIAALPSSTSHPYTATDTASCAHSNSEAAAYVQEWFAPCAVGDEDCLKSLIGGDGCEYFMTTAIKTSIEVVDSFYYYSGGIYSDANCPSDKHNHAVAIVGWGTDETTKQDYWILRNSWGDSWGLNGYFYMERGTNMCCVACDNLFFQ